MTKFQIWIEGYAATGESGQASLVGEHEGTDFKDACRKFFAAKRDRYYSLETNTYWGCKLFPTEVEARKSFG